jgi:hypothetical protein
MMNTPRRLAITCVALLPIAGCMNLRLYEGEQRAASMIATVSGDYKIRAGAPMSLLLRKVDETPLDVRYSSVQVLPGVHTLLIDCQLQSQGTTRHEIKAELEAGVRYRIVADTNRGNRECENVHLKAVN